MNEYEVVWSLESIYDVADISEYIEQEFGIERAEQFINEIDIEVEKLSYLFSAFSDTGIFYRGLIIHKMLFNPSIVFYSVDKNEEKVFILRVLRHERNWQRILRTQIMYTFE